MLKFKLTLFFFAFAVTHCRTVNNGTNDIALQCGITSEDSKKNKFVKLINYDENEIKGIELSALEGIVVLDLIGSSPVHFTSKGCVVVPNLPGTIHVRNPISESTVSFSVQDLSQQPDFGVQKMIPYRGLWFRISCDWSDPYADRMIKIPMEISNLEDPGSLGLSIQLHPLDSREKGLREIYHKHIGELELDLPESYSLEGVPAGRYMLVVMGRHIGDNLYGPFQKLSPDYCVINLK